MEDKKSFSFIEDKKSSISWKTRNFYLMEDEKSSSFIEDKKSSISWRTRNLSAS